MLLIRSLIVASVLLGTLSCVAFSQGYDQSLSLRQGYGIASESDFENSLSTQLLGAKPLGQRTLFLAAVGYHPSARTVFGNTFCFGDRGCPHAHQNAGLVSFGVGLRYRLGNLNANPNLPFVEVVPTLFYGSWEAQETPLAGVEYFPGLRRVIPGFEANWLVPIPLGSELSFEVGGGYAYSAGVRRDPGSERKGLRHLRMLVGLTYAHLEQ